MPGPRQPHRERPRNVSTPGSAASPQSRRNPTNSLDTKLRAGGSMKAVTFADSGEYFARIAGLGGSIVFARFCTSLCTWWRTRCSDNSSSTCLFLAWPAWSVWAWGSPAWAVNLLLNPSFEAPAGTAGDDQNFVAWTPVNDVSRAVRQPHPFGRVWSVGQDLDARRRRRQADSDPGSSPVRRTYFSSWIKFENAFPTITDPCCGSPGELAGCGQWPCRVPDHVEPGTGFRGSCRYLGRARIHLRRRSGRSSTSDAFPRRGRRPGRRWCAVGLL